MPIVMKIRRQHRQHNDRQQPLRFFSGAFFSLFVVLLLFETLEDLFSDGELVFG
jgi:hypothetical protein